jgi:hypothetical protein
MFEYIEQGNQVVTTILEGAEVRQSNLRDRPTASPNGHFSGPVVKLSRRDMTKP